MCCSFAIFALKPELQYQLGCHVLAFSEMLSAWQLPHKRSELLKSTHSALRACFPKPFILDILESSPLGSYQISFLLFKESVLFLFGVIPFDFLD